LISFFQQQDQPYTPASSSLQPDYVFYGPRERRLGDGKWRPEAAWMLVCQQGEVTVYKVSPSP
jgi:hypothetical protein